MSAGLEQTPLDWTAEGAPRSRRFDDIYFSAEDGLAESRTVFLQGCGLPQGWAGRPRFTVGELGFGTGLNVLALLDAWRWSRTPGQRLSIFSIEAFPLSAEEAAHALGAWPELADLAALLIARWPRRARGFHRIDFPELGASLDLAVGEADWALDQWTGHADAWFLDGFSPAKNPRMWGEPVLTAVAVLPAPGARLATFTVAGAVRRGLGAAGFDVAKRPGHGRKRERLEARLPEEPAATRADPRVVVIGAGIAGAALARAFSALGVRPLVLEAEAPGAGASGNAAALVTPALDAGGGPRAALYAQAFARAVDLYQALGQAAVVDQGVLQLEHGPRDPARFNTVAASDLFDPHLLDHQEGALLFREGLVIRPAAVLGAWVAEGDLVRGRASRLQRIDAGWRVLDADGETLAEADAVCIATGAGVRTLWPDAPVCPVRGQTSWTADLTVDRAVAWGGYAIPLEGGLLFGATHDRGRDGVEVLEADHRRNLQTLAHILPPALALDPASLIGRAGVRAATPDLMPLAGAVPGPDGLYVLGGLGSRGFTTAPVLAEHIAALILDAPSPLPADLQRMVRPSRFDLLETPQDDRKAQA